MSDLVFIDGYEIKELLKDKDFIYFNGYKYYFTQDDLTKLNNSTVYMMFQKYGKLFIKPMRGKSVIVKRGVKVPKKS